jgi:hypothetical protein
LSKAAGAKGANLIETGISRAYRINLTPDKVAVDATFDELQKFNLLDDKDFEQLLRMASATSSLPCQRAVICVSMNP